MYLISFKIVYSVFSVFLLGLGFLVSQNMETDIAGFSIIIFAIMLLIIVIFPDKTIAPLIKLLYSFLSCFLPEVLL